MTKRSVLVVGGGPAGMMAAITAAEAGAIVTLCDANEKLGKKLYITGKGRCNLTNACEREKLIKNIPRNPRFLFSALSKMDNLKLMTYMEALNVPLVVERGERVFPASGKSSDITRALQSRLAGLDVRIRLNDPCRGLIIENGKLTGAHFVSGDFRCDALVLATGGMSYPATGSTGDGYRFAREAGHDVVPPRASLVPLETLDAWPCALQGLSLRNVELCASQGKKLFYKERGEMLFTHFGISGPLTLSLSAHLSGDLSAVCVWIDLKPALTPEEVAARLLNELSNGQRKRVNVLLAALLPGRLARIFPDIIGLNADIVAHQITRSQRFVIADALKYLPIPIKNLRPIDEAVITRGGVEVRQVGPRDMQSKLVRGLHFAGELLDVDGYTGGFNLTIAFITGYAAGYAAAQGEEMEYDETKQPRCCQGGD